MGWENVGTAVMLNLPVANRMVPAAPNLSASASVVDRPSGLSATVEKMVEVESMMVIRFLRCAATNGVTESR